MRSCTRLNANETGRKTREECQEFATTQLPAEQDFTVGSDTVDLKNILRDIQTDCGNVHWTQLVFEKDSHHNPPRLGSRGCPPHQMYGRGKLDLLQARLIGAV